MNAYKLNGLSGHYYRRIVCEHLNIPHTEIYKTVKNVQGDGIIVLHDGRKFKPELKEIE